MTSHFVSDMLTFPVTSDDYAWYFNYGLHAIAIVLALATYGFYTSLGRRPAFRPALDGG